MSDHEAIVRGSLHHAATTDDFASADAALDRLVAERDAANVEWHRIRGLHVAAIADLRVVVAERDAALADLADERNDSVQDKDYIVQLKADNKRLRDALEQIGSKDFDMTELGRIARAALSSWDEA